MKKYPIHCTSIGPDFGKPVEGVFTYNPIKEGDTFVTTHKGKKITFKVDMNFYTDPHAVTVEVVSVKEKF